MESRKKKRIGSLTLVFSVEYSRHRFDDRGAAVHRHPRSRATVSFAAFANRRWAGRSYVRRVQRTVDTPNGSRGVASRRETTVTTMCKRPE
jgi:hypothetical protein